MGKTSIGWCDYTWNFFVAYNAATGRRGHFCVHVNDACTHCYAERFNLSPRGLGTGIPFRAQDAEKVRLELHEKTLAQFKKWKPGLKVFVEDMSDLFYEGYPDAWLDRAFDVMESRPDIIKQLLTKRYKRMWEYLNRRWGTLERSDFWIGASAGTQKDAGLAWRWLMQTPAKIRFLSLEPLLEPIDLNRLEDPVTGRPLDALRGTIQYDFPITAWGAAEEHKLPRADWVIFGGESGPNYRTMLKGWAVQISEDCRRAGVARWFKQDSGPKPGLRADLLGEKIQEFPQLPD